MSVPIKNAAVALIVLLGATACASAPQRFDAGAHSDIKRIAILEIPQPQRKTINNFGNPAAVIGGGVGAGIAAAASAFNNKGPFEALIEQEGFDFPSEMKQALARTLEAKGYEVTYKQVSRDNPMAPMNDYSSLGDVDADAVLDVANGLYFGYSNVTMFDYKFRPHLDVKLKLADPRSGEVYYEDHYVYGYSNPLMSGNQLDAPEDYYFDDSDAVLADGKRAVEGLRAGIGTIAQSVGDSFTQ